MQKTHFKLIWEEIPSCKNKFHPIYRWVYFQHNAETWEQRTEWLADWLIVARAFARLLARCAPHKTTTSLTTTLDDVNSCALADRKQDNRGGPDSRLYHSQTGSRTIEGRTADYQTGSRITDGKNRRPCHPQTYDNGNMTIDKGRTANYAGQRPTKSLKCVHRI